MTKAVEALKEEWYTLTEDAGNASAPQFLLRPLYGIEELDVRFRIDGNGNGSMDKNCATAVLDAGLLNWRNFKDSHGPVVFDRDHRAGNLRRLSLQQVVELAVEIYSRTKLSPEERKNLSSQSTSQPKIESPSIAAPDAPGDGTATTATQPG